MAAPASPPASAPSAAGAPAGLRGFLRRHALALGVAAAAGLLYVPSLGHPFVYDDTINIVKNPSIRRLADWPRFFTETETATSNESFERVYRPLSTLSYALDYALGGLDPRGYILHNLLLHALSAGLCVAVFWALTGSPWLGAAAGLALGLHPVQTEPVNWPTGRATLLFGVFYLISVRLYLVAARRGKVSTWSSSSADGGGEPTAAAATSGIPAGSAAGLWAISWLAAAASLLSKEMAVTLPASLLLAEWLLPPDPGARWKRRLAHLAPYAALAVGFLGTRAALLGSGVAREEYWGGSPWKTLQVMGKVMARYASLLALPVGQNIEHTVSIPETWWDAPSLAGFALVAAVAGLALWLRRRRPVVSFGLLWMGVGLAPVSNLIPFYGLIAERHLYLITAGFGLALGDALLWLCGGAERRRALAAALAGLGIVYAGASLARSRVWSDEILLWRDTVAKSPGKVKAHNNLGLAYLRRHRVDEAMAEFRKALEIYPRSAGAHANLGLVYLERNQPERAVEELLQATRENPRHLDAHKHLANAYLRLGRWQEAEGVARQALAVRDDPDIRYLLGAALLKQSRIEDAETEFRKVLERDALHADALRQVGLIRHRQGRTDEALNLYRRALAAAPAPDLLFNIGLIEMKRGEYAAAATDFARSRALAPEVPEVALRQAQAEILRDLAGRGRAEKARELDTEDVRRHAAAAALLRALPDAASIASRLAPAGEARAAPPVRAAILATLALLERAQGKTGEARSRYEAMLQAGGDTAAVHLAIGEMAAQSGDHAQAERHLRQALALDPALPQAYARLAFLARLRGDSGAALALYDRALAAAPGYEAGLDGRCKTLYELERWGEAARCFEERIQARPDHPQAHYYLARLYRRLGNPVKARTEFERHQEILRGQGPAGDTAASLE